MKSRTRFRLEVPPQRRAGYWTKVQWQRSERSPDTADNNERSKAMKPCESQRFHRSLTNILFAVSCSAIILSLGQPFALAQQAQSSATTTTTSPAEQTPKIPNDQLDSLVAPIALY